MWQVQDDITDQDLHILKSKGINLVQSFGIASVNEAKLDRYLSRMRSAGLGVVMSLQPFLKQDSSGHWLEEFDEQRLRAFLIRWKSNDSIVMWHTVDEPSFKGLRTPFLRRIYRFVKSIDPARPVLLSWDGRTERDYACCFSRRSFDILDIHSYVNGLSLTPQRRFVATYLHHSMGIPAGELIVTIRAFDGRGWAPLKPGQIQEQLTLYETMSLTKNFGFYGWKLNPNVGISQRNSWRREFESLELN